MYFPHAVLLQIAHVAFRDAVLPFVRILTLGVERTPPRMTKSSQQHVLMLLDLRLIYPHYRRPMSHSKN